MSKKHNHKKKIIKKNVKEKQLRQKPLKEKAPVKLKVKKTIFEKLKSPSVIESILDCTSIFSILIFLVFSVIWIWLSRQVGSHLAVAMRNLVFSTNMIILIIFFISSFIDLIRFNKEEKNKNKDREKGDFSLFAVGFSLLFISWAVLANSMSVEKSFKDFIFVLQGESKIIEFTQETNVDIRRSRRSQLVCNHTEIITLEDGTEYEYDAITNQLIFKKREYLYNKCIKR